MKHTPISPAALRKAQEHARLGIMAMSMGEITRAIGELRAATHGVPIHPDIAMQLGAALIRSGQLEQALLWLQRANDAEQSMRVSSAELFVYNCMDDNAQLTPARRLAQHEAWAHRWTDNVTPMKQRKPRCDPLGKPLRIGYVSADFKHHPVASFMRPIVKHAIRQPYLYYNGARLDDESLWFKEQVPDTWRHVCKRTDRELAQQIADDDIDILVDLSGHTSGNRLGVFAMKPAPIQVTYLGYGNTTGMKQMDYRITDGVTDVDGDDAYYSETLVRLPGCFLCWQPPENAPDVAIVDTKRPMRFGSFNAAHKINERTIRLWASVLQDVPESVLVLKSDAFRDDGVRQRYEKMFALAGVPCSRIEFWAPPSDYAAHLSLYEDIDVALDTVPYNGTTTTCEAAWMGVPTLTLRGDRHLSRVSTSINKAIGSTCAFNCHTENEFVAFASELSRARDTLSERRKELREDIRTSPLCDGAAFTRGLEEAYRMIVERHNG